MKISHSWSEGVYIIELPPLNTWFDTPEMPNLFCLTSTKLACTNDGGGESRAYVKVTSTDSCRIGGVVGVGTTEMVYVGRIGCDSLLMSVCGSVGAEWTTMGTFC